jgi:UDP-N-acetylmuramoylalanine--D-glutamate ligase
VITSEIWRGRRYAVLGLARSGAATVRALLASGAEVVAWDESEEVRSTFCRHAELVSASIPTRDQPVPKETWTLKQVQGDGSMQWGDPLTLDLTGFTAVVASPGIPLNRHPITAHAIKYSVPVIGDIELFAQARAELPPHKVVGITGTNGKSTTTALVHHILKTAGVPVTMGGNIGLPILGQDPLPKGGVYVLELSSYQIDLTFTLDCDVAVLLNVTPDHLDRYDGFEAYAAAKFRLFSMQWAEHVGIVAIDDETTTAMTLRLLSPTTVSARNVTDQGSWQTLQGPHNAQNVAAACAVADALSVDRHIVAEALKTFPGLPHRMERICEKDGVLWVNDSKATNPTSTAPALAAYPAIHWILGGQAKTDELDACAPHFSRVKAAYTIGRDGPMLAALLRQYMIVSECGELREAVRRTSYAAKSGETVLLSPACASFDQFSNFEDRGDAFRTLVEAL